MRLAAKFYEPMTPELLAELEAYQAILNSEVQRVANVCKHFQKHVFNNRHNNVAQIKGARA